MVISHGHFRNGYTWVLQCQKVFAIDCNFNWHWQFQNVPLGTCVFVPKLNMATLFEIPLKSFLWVLFSTLLFPFPWWTGWMVTVQSAAVKLGFNVHLVCLHSQSCWFSYHCSGLWEQWLTRTNSTCSCWWLNKWMLCQTGKPKNYWHSAELGSLLYSLFHSPRPVFHWPDQIFTRIGERVSASFQLVCGSCG